MMGQIALLLILPVVACASDQTPFVLSRKLEAPELKDALLIAFRQQALGNGTGWMGEDTEAFCNDTHNPSLGSAGFPTEMTGLWHHYVPEKTEQTSVMDEAEKTKPFFRIAGLKPAAE